MRMSEPRESPALRQAILRVQPEYFFWNQQEQETYRVNIPREPTFRTPLIWANEFSRVILCTRKRQTAVCFHITRGAKTRAFPPWRAG